MPTAVKTPPDQDDVLDRATRTARELAADRCAPVTVLRRSPTVLVAVDDVVVKVHLPDTEVDALAARLRLAADPTLAGCLLAPLDPRPRAVGPLWASAWPRIAPLPQTADTVPWGQTGRLLARLHTTPPPLPRTAAPGGDPEPPVNPCEPRQDPPTLPIHGAVERLHRALRDLDAALSGADRPLDAPLRAAVDVVRRAADELPPRAWTPYLPDRPAALVHGDWHLGQLGRRDRPPGPWLLIDIDDLGLGDPIWDLARPAAFWACGLLPDRDWHAFLDGYRAGGGRLADDPWPELDPVSRACAVQTAAASIRRVVARPTPHELDDVDRRLIEACARMTTRP